MTPMTSPRFVLHLQERLLRPGRGVRDDDVEAAGVGEHVVDRSVASGQLGQLGVDAFGLHPEITKFSCGGFGAVGKVVDNVDRGGAFTSEPEGGRASDAAAPTGHQHDLPAVSFGCEFTSLKNDFPAIMLYAYRKVKRLPEGARRRPKRSVMSPKGSRSSDSEPPRGVARLVDVAALAGVGTSIASRVLNDDPNVGVRPETRARIIGAAQELNTDRTRPPAASSCSAPPPWGW